MGLQIALDPNLLFCAFVDDVVYPPFLVSDSLGSYWAAIVFLSLIMCDLWPFHMKSGSEIMAAIEEMSLAMAEETLLSNNSLVVVHHLLLFHQMEGFLNHIFITFSS